MGNTIKIPVIPFDEQNTEDAAGKPSNGNGVYKRKPVPGGGGKPGTYTPEKD